MKMAESNSHIDVCNYASKTQRGLQIAVSPEPASSSRCFFDIVLAEKGGYCAYYM